MLLAAVALAACNDQGSVTVHSLSFEGVKSVDESKLRQALATKENSKVPLAGWELPWEQKSRFDRGRLEADLQRIKAFYADRGFPDARITDFKVAFNSSQTSVDVTVIIDEGQPVKVASVTFNGFEALPAERLENLERNLPLKVGQPRDRQLVVTAREQALDELRDHGYPYAKISTAEDDGPTGKAAAIAFTAQPGPIAHFGSVDIAGNHSVSNGIIERELAFHAGDLYQRSLVQNSQRRLYGMELFQFVNIETLDPDAQDPDVKTRVTVAEGRHQRINFGVGYGTDEKARVDAEYHHLNFLGGARSAGVHVRYSSLDRGLRVDFTQPYFIAPHFSLGGEAQQWYTYTPAYDSFVLGGKVTLTHRTTPRMSWSASYIAERDESTVSDAARQDPALIGDLIAIGLDPSTGQQTGTLNAFGFDLQRTTANSVLNASRGYQVALHAEWAAPFLPGTFNYYGLSFDGRHYHAAGDHFVIASHLQYGNIEAADNDPGNVPFSKKYFLGGATSLRGWGRFEVSPVGESGIPLGGDSMIAVSEELRTTLGRNLGVVLFLDAGNVWPDRTSFDLGDLRYDVGSGIRYQTPVGPLRFDFGYQINPIPDLLVNGEPQTRRWRMHFSIGQAF